MREISSIRPASTVKKPFGLSTTEDAKDDVSAQINGEGTVVKKIGKGEIETTSVASGRTLVAKRPSSDSNDAAKARAEARKAEIAAKRAAKKEG